MDDLDRQTLMGMTITFVALAAGYKVIERYQPRSASMLFGGLDERVTSRLDQDLSHSYSTKVSTVRTAKGVSYIHQTLRIPLRPTSASPTSAMTQRPNLIQELVDMVESFPKATLVALWILVVALMSAILYYFYRHGQHQQESQQLRDEKRRLQNFVSFKSERLRATRERAKIEIDQLLADNEDLQSDLDHQDQALQTLRDLRDNDFRVAFEANQQATEMIEDLQMSLDEAEQTAATWEDRAYVLAQRLQGALAEIKELRPQIVALQNLVDELEDQLAESQMETKTPSVPANHAHRNKDRSLVLYRASRGILSMANNAPTSADDVIASYVKSLLIYEHEAVATAREILDYEIATGFLCDRVRELEAQVQYLEEKALGMHTPSYPRHWRMRFGGPGLKRPTFSGITPAGRTFDKNTPSFGKSRGGRRYRKLQAA